MRGKNFGGKIYRTHGGLKHVDDFFQRVDFADVAGKNYVAHAGEFAFRADFPNGHASRHLPQDERALDAQTFRAYVCGSYAALRD